MTQDYTQFNLFLWAGFIGCVLAFVYDLIKIFRYAIPHKQLLIYIEDGIFWIVSTFVTFQKSLAVNYGEIRFYLLMGIFIGMFLYSKTLSIVIMSCSQKIIDIIKFILNLFIEITLTPIKLIYKLIVKPIQNIVMVITKKLFKIFLKHLQYLKVYVKIKVMDFMRNKRMLKKCKIQFKNIRNEKEVKKK